MVTDNGFKMNVNGMNYERFSLNPTLLWQHGEDPMHQLPIGRISKILRTPNSIDFVPQYANHPWALEVAAQEKAGFLPGNSIGWIPNELVPFEDHIFISAWTLIEISKVVIPADKYALTSQ